MTKWVIRSKQLRKGLFNDDDDETIKKWMLPGHYLIGTKVLKRARKIMRCLLNFLMREAMNTILGRFRLPAVAIKLYKILQT